MKDADVPPGHAFAETRDLHPRDRFLRRHGFRIEHRPKGAEAVWSLNGRRYTQSEALALCEESS